MTVLLALLAALSIWDYPARQLRHETLRGDFVRAVREGRADGMEAAARAGSALFPDDPVWRYNLACSLARAKKTAPALLALEEAIDLGFRKPDEIAKDADLHGLVSERRFHELIEYAKEIATKPILTGPLAAVNATGFFGQPVALGQQNLTWNFETGCYEAKLKLESSVVAGNTGDLYVNRDNEHSLLRVAGIPGLTHVKFDKELRDHGLGLNIPDTLYPYPAFGNCSMAYTKGPYWRSLPRALTTTEAYRMRVMARLYLANQFWVFPICADAPPLGKHGDVCTALTPYLIATQGRSWSDRPYVELGLEVSRSFKPDVKREIVRRGLLAPTIMTLIRKALTNVTDEASYLSPKAHPTAFPSVAAVDRTRLVASAANMTAAQVPPLAVVRVVPEAVTPPPTGPELVYGTVFAWSFVLRSVDETRSFVLSAVGAREFRFVQTHGNGVEVSIDAVAPDKARVSLRSMGISPTNRVDIAVFGRNPGTDWGAPSYVSFSRLDASAPYCDPYFTAVSEAKSP